MTRNYMSDSQITIYKNKKNYNMNDHVITGGFRCIRKQMYKLYIE